MSATDAMLQMSQSDKKFRSDLEKVKSACHQVALLNKKIVGLQERYKRAQAVKRRSFCYTLRMNIATIEGVRSMFYEYADRKARQLFKIARHHARRQRQQGFQAPVPGIMPAPGDDTQDMDTTEGIVGTTEDIVNTADGIADHTEGIADTS